MQGAWRTGCVVWLVLWASAGCTASDEASARDSSDGNAGEAAGAGGSGGDFSGGGDAAAPALTEDPRIECDGAGAVTSCGGVTCAGPDPFAAQSCQLVCCTTDGSCGLRAADDGVCTAEPSAASGCPDAMLDLGGGSEFVRGCCTATGTCGAVAFGECLPRARLDLDVVPCELDDAGVDDAGSGP